MKNSLGNMEETITFTHVKINELNNMIRDRYLPMKKMLVAFRGTIWYSIK